MGWDCESGLGLSRLRLEDFEQHEACADDDAGVGDVEVWPVVVVDLHGEEVDDMVEADAVVEVADCAAKDQREGDGGKGKGAASGAEQGEDNDGGDDGEADEAETDSVGRQVFEEGECGAGVEDVGEAEASRDDRDIVAGTDAVDDPVLGEAVGDDDEGADEEEDGAAVWGVASCRLQVVSVGSGHGDEGHFSGLCLYVVVVRLGLAGSYVAGLQPFVFYFGSLPRPSA